MAAKAIINQQSNETELVSTFTYRKYFIVSNKYKCNLTYFHLLIHSERFKLISDSYFLGTKND